MTTDSIKYPVHLDEKFLMGANKELIAHLVSVTDWEATHIVERLNLASAVIAKMKEHGWIDKSGAITHPVVGFEYNDWTDAAVACVEFAME